jgi:hypothetical protein
MQTVTTIGFDYDDAFAGIGQLIHHVTADIASATSN